MTRNQTSLQENKKETNSILKNREKFQEGCLIIDFVISERLRPKKKKKPFLFGSVPFCSLKKCEGRTESC